MSNARTTYRLITSEMKRLGLPLPESFANTNKSLDELVDRGSALLTRDRDALTTAVAGALLANRDPAADKKVQIELNRQMLEPSGREIIAHIDETGRMNAISSSFDEILKGLKASVCEANESINRARAVLRFNTTDDASMYQNPQHLELWAQARNAAQRVDVALGLWTILVNELRLVSIGRDRLLAIAPLTLDEYESFQRATPDVYDVINAGYNVDLATPAEFRERVAALQDARVARESGVQNDNRLATQQWFGFRP